MILLLLSHRFTDTVDVVHAIVNHPNKQVAANTVIGTNLFFSFRNMNLIFIDIILLPCIFKFLTTVTLILWLFS